MKDIQRRSSRCSKSGIFIIFQSAEIRALAEVIGEEELSDTDKSYMEFGLQFEHMFVNQDFYENRDIDKTLDMMWQLLSILPQEELTRIDPSLVKSIWEVMV